MGAQPLHKLQRHRWGKIRKRLHDLREGEHAYFPVKDFNTVTTTCQRLRFCYSDGRRFSVVRKFARNRWTPPNSIKVTRLRLAAEENSADATSISEHDTDRQSAGA